MAANEGNAPNGSGDAIQSVGGLLAAQRQGLTEALKELDRGERTADKLEAELGAFEQKLEQLLALVGMSEADLEEEDEGADKDDEDDEDDEDKNGTAREEDTDSSSPKETSDSSRQA